jgi:hypothetical protein
MRFFFVVYSSNMKMGGFIFLRNIGCLSPDYTTLYPRRQSSSWNLKPVFALCMTQTNDCQAGKQCGRHVDDPYYSLLYSSQLRINVWLCVYYNFCTVCIPSPMHHWVFPKQLLLWITKLTPECVEDVAYRVCRENGCHCDAMSSSSSALRIRPSGLFSIRINPALWIQQTAGRTPWTGDQPCRKVATCTGQHKHRRNAHRHPCLEWDSNPCSQCSNRRRHFMP